MKTLLIILLFTACQHPAMEVQKRDTVIIHDTVFKMYGGSRGSYVSQSDYNSKMTDLDAKIAKLNSSVAALQTQMKSKSDTTTFYFKHGEGGFSGSGKYYDELRQYDGQ